ncbi:DEAH-box ATP-dependent RNA helicase prp43 [Diaporthe eres]
MRVTTRVAETNGVNLGVEVGFTVRFNSKTSGAMRLVRDGQSALKEAENDRYLSKYSFVIADEVHERGIDTDPLMGILKMTLKSRKGFKVIIMSATLVAKFDARSRARVFLLLSDYITAVGPISKAQAVQRMGRAVRTGPGKCVRICTKDAYEQHTVQSPVPAMAHSSMDAVLLKLHEMRFDDVLRFPFVDPPAVEVLLRAMEDLMNM